MQSFVYLLLVCRFRFRTSQCVDMEVDSVNVEDEKRLAQLRFEAAVKVIKSLPPDGK